MTKKAKSTSGKKSIRAQLRAKGEELKLRYPKRRAPLVCVRCGEIVERGKLLMHKELAHGEKRITESPPQPHSENLWIPIHSGGLPSLGKNSR